MVKTHCWETKEDAAVKLVKLVTGKQESHVRSVGIPGMSICRAWIPLFLPCIKRITAVEGPRLLNGLLVKHDVGGLPRYILSGTVTIRSGQHEQHPTP